MSVSNSYYQTLLRNSGLVQESDEYVAWLLAQGGTIPTMVSYELGLKGPSIFVHSNCSSSLVAISLAYQTLQLGEAKYAIVGASTVFSSSSVGYVYRPGLNFSSDGHCKTFDSSADGMVAGEGVGVIVLKRAQDAIEDGDHIYSLLRGVGVNNDGSDKAGFYSPGVSGQSEVIQKVLSSTGVDPSSISYIEAHGTGTKLGDPIEVLALTEVYQKYTAKRQFCGIGSVKPNIGHLDTASGLAGFIKVALSLKHKEIPPSINYANPNPEIDFENSPFYVVDQLQKWSTGAAPLRAALSSFGIGGTNAHAILEEYSVSHTAESRQVVSKPNDALKFLIPLSARNKDRLNAYVKQLSAFLNEIPSHETQDSTSYLESLSFTLQVGREAMRSRAVFVVTSVGELIEKLQRFVTSGEQSNLRESLDYYQGESRKAREGIMLFEKDEDWRDLIVNWLAKGKFELLAKFWVDGGFIDWNKLYQGREASNRPHRISLPTYPFAKERYWVPTEEGRQLTGAQEKGRLKNTENTSFLHPLLHKNTSSFSTQKFSSTFTGEEFFLRDHQIQGEKVLPGVAYLEMAHEAIKRAVSGFSTENQEIHFSNVVWAKPIIVGSDPQEVHIELFPEESGEIAFKVYTDNDPDQEKPTVHGQGLARLLSSGEVDAEDRAIIDIDNLRKSLIKKSIDAKECYEIFQLMGFDYGLAHQGLEKIYIGENVEGGAEVLAKLILPPSVRESKNQFTLHPSLLDSALQASIGMVAELDPHKSRLFLPFGLESVEAITSCTTSMWAWVRLIQPPRRHSKSNKGHSIQKLDIDLCDEAGNVCVKLRGFSSRSLEGEISARQPSVTDSATGLLMVKPVWKEKSVYDYSDPHQKLAGYTDHRVFLCGFPEIDASRINPKFTGELPCPSITNLDNNDVAIQQMAAMELPLAPCFEMYSLKLFEAIKKILEGRPKGNLLLQVLVPAQGPQQVYSALSGLIKTARLENPKLLGQVIAVENDISPENILAKLQENSQFPEDHQIRYELQSDKVNDQAAERRLVLFFEEEERTNSDQDMPWKNRGVYLITGGAGGLGLIFAREAVEKVPDVTLILTGRSALNKEIEAELVALRNSGATIEYQSIDVSDEQSVEALVDSIFHRFGSLNGVLHCAGVIKDNFILKKSRTEFEEVLKPKVKGVMNLDRATKSFADLDFFVLFSSGVGAMGNAGQADYATANAFMDVFSKVRDTLVRSKERSGQTLSINWPLWKGGGMGVDEETGRMMEESIGMVPMDTSLGIAAFYQALKLGEPQVLVMSGLLNRMKKTFLSTPTKVSKRSSGSAAASPILVKVHSSGDLNYLLDRIQKSLMEMISELLKVSIEDLDSSAELSEYGFDSITVTNFSGQLNQKYKLKLPPTIFFEYPTIEELANYLADEHREVFKKYLIVRDPSQ
jgi:acyl transferase domain-containing protein/acyl carrier protein